MPIKVEIIGGAPGQASLKIVGLGGTAPEAGQMRLTRINSKTSLGVDLNWHADEQWLPLPELSAEGNALHGRVGPELVDPLALLGPSDIVGMAVRVDGRTEEGRVKTDKLCASHVHGSAAAPIVQPPAPPPETGNVAEEPPVPDPEQPPVPPTPLQDPPPAPPRQSRLPLIIGAIACVLMLGAIGAYFAGLFDRNEPAAVEAAAEPPKKPEEPALADAPSDINSREDLAKFIQATPDADKAYQTARTLAEKGKLEFAMLLFQHAARGGSNDASVAVARMYDPETWNQQTSPMPQADAETAAYWYEPPAQAGNVEAQRQLGKIMVELTPDGFQHDKGREWLQKAADAGDEKAKLLLEKNK